MKISKVENCREKKYWDEFYTKHRDPFEPSQFALFTLDSIKEAKTLCELGCGNGRDSIYFGKYGIEVTACDRAEEEIAYLQTNYGRPGMRFLCMDFKDIDSLEGTFDIIYSRFSLHSIPIELESAVLRWCFEHLADGGRIFLETRSIHDQMLQRGLRLSSFENMTDHYRRYYNMDDLARKLENIGFHTMLKEESDEFAPYSDEKPVVVRIVGRRTKNSAERK